MNAPLQQQCNLKAVSEAKKPMVQLGKAAREPQLALHGYERHTNLPLNYWLCSACLLTYSMQWGLYAGMLGGAGYFMSPIYRGLTIQFKV